MLHSERTSRSSAGPLAESVRERSDQPKLHQVLSRSLFGSEATKDALRTLNSYLQHHSSDLFRRFRDNHVQQVDDEEEEEDLEASLLDDYNSEDAEAGKKAKKRKKMLASLMLCHGTSTF